ncbi:hypothetical protein BO70DRAFT_422338 [Aspergillus heteromorphus CBS 117.55]|uniref:Uncharacterized protein n=1 Tax=Aspergillus heteromorphus CBS 117.55 TaxID=1448321 RepID=A0A317WJU9_9EURO|nr:uncharacterized protein BO70DRAFT_422338 [Aspergillus heteromorphus CBS 117.55]PWY86724.1 hypothetical protein BO70DRAFT_422338 [Aspergillus heteromorphus CBS 117.55]
MEITLLGNIIDIILQHWRTGSGESGRASLSPFGYNLYPQFRIACLGSISTSSDHESVLESRSLRVQVPRHPRQPLRRQLFFVDVSDKNHRQNARSHIVTERLRDLRRCPRDRVHAATKPPKVPDRPTTGSTRKRRYGQRIRLDGPTDPEKAASTAPALPAITPRDLGSFQTWPVPFTPEVLLLVDHYINIIPTLLHPPTQKPPQQRNLAIDLFHIYRLHPASFQGMLYHSARHREGLYQSDRPTPTSASLPWKIQTLRAINHQISKSQTTNTHPDDGTIMAIYLLSAAERMWGDLGTFRLHWRAMYDIIDARGGAEAFVTDDLVFAKVLWNCFALLNAEDGYYNCPAAVGERSGGANYDFVLPPASMLMNCHYFGRVFAERKGAVLKAVPGSEDEMLMQREMYPWRVGSFKPGSMLYRVLCPTSNGKSKSRLHLTSQNPPQTYPVRIQGDRLKTDNCRLACIIYLNLLFIQLGDFSARTETFLLALENELAPLIQMNMDMLSPEYLLWILLRCQTVLPAQQSRELWMQAIRVIAVVKRARYQSLVQYARAMFLFLEIPTDARRLAAVMEVDLETIQDEALGVGMDRGIEGLLDDRDLKPSSGGGCLGESSGGLSELFWFAGGQT